MSEKLQELIDLRDKIRTHEDTVDYYEIVFAADGIVDPQERSQLNKLAAAIKQIKSIIQEKEQHLKSGAGVANFFNKATESIGDILSKKDDIVDHSLVDQTTTTKERTTTEGRTTTKETTTTEGTTTTEETTDTSDGSRTTAPSSAGNKYAAIAETPAVKKFLENIHNSEGGYVDDANDPGGKTKYGIAEKREWPAFAAMFGLDANNPELIKDITKEQVDEYYIKSRFEQNGLDKINSSKVINAIFDQSILTPGIVKKNMKRALNALGSNHNFPLNNSEFSAAEITAINTTDDNKLVEKFVSYQNAYYDALVKKNPSKFGKYINGWKNRTARLTGFSGSSNDTSETNGGEESSDRNNSDTSTGNTFEVPSGWGLQQIANEHGITVEQLKAWNGDKLKTYSSGEQGFNIGEMVVVKGGSSDGGSEDTFVVPKGWGIKKIARKNKITVEQLIAWNSDKVKTYSNGKQGFDVGEIIVIKGGSVPTSDKTGDEEGEVTEGGQIKPSWVREAEKHLGKKETARMVKDDPWITMLFEELGASASGWAQEQTVGNANWCAAFVSYCFKQTGQSPLSGFDGMRALTYADKYGTEVTRPVYGALAIVQRGGAGHIGFVIGYNKRNGKITLLGGNQGNKVSIKKEGRTLIAYKVPSGWSIPEQNYLD